LTIKACVRLLACGVLVVQLGLAGCMSARDAAKESRAPTNQVFQPDGKLVGLQAGRASSFAEFTRGGAQSVALLQLSSDAVLSKRCHSNHDMVLFVVSGGGIVAVEDVRYVVKPGSAVVLPRLTAYSIMPADNGGDFVAVMVFTPPFDPDDVKLM